MQSVNQARMAVLLDDGRSIAFAPHTIGRGIPLYVNAEN